MEFRPQGLSPSVESVGGEQESEDAARRGRTPSERRGNQTIRGGPDQEAGPLRVRAERPITLRCEPFETPRSSAPQDELREPRNLPASGTEVDFETLAG